MKKMRFLMVAAAVGIAFGTTFEAAAGVATEAQGRAKKKADQATAAWKYDIEYARTGAGNMLMVKVWSYAPKSAVAIEQGRKNAVHGVIFKGYTAAESGAVSQKPLMKEPDAYAQHQSFFDEFFADGGAYMKYVSAAADGSTNVVKVGKEFKAAVTVTVNKDQLRADLEAAGIIRSLGAGF